MIVRYPKDTSSTGTREESKTPPPNESEHVHDDTCRCEETAKMTPRQLLGLMMSDLAFWKTKKQRSGKD